MKIINTQDGQYKKPGAGACIGGVMAGGVVQSIVQRPHQLIVTKILDKMNNISNNLSNDEFENVNSAIVKTLDKTGLSKKGVSVLKVTADNMDELSNVMSNEINANKITKKLPEFIKRMQAKNISETVLEGDNAFYTFVTKKVVVPEGKSLALSVFHELGHAANSNLSKIGKFLQKRRKLSLLAIPISFIALWKTKKAPGEQPKNKIDKATTFVKENVGKLTLAAFLPTLVEEGMATVKGNKFAKNLLDPSLAKKVSKTNTMAYASYLCLAVLSSFGIYLGTKIKDYIAKPKPVNQV